MACTIDFRSLDGGKTCKRKRAAQSIILRESSMEIDTPAAKRSAVASSENPDKPIFGQVTYHVVIDEKVSGRKWKQARKQRASIGERDREKEVEKVYRERMNELKEEIRKNEVEKMKMKKEREKRKISGRDWNRARKQMVLAAKEEREKRKQENILKGTTFEEVRKGYRERMNELNEKIRKNKVEKMKMEEEREKRKQENILRSGTKLQKISNPKKIVKQEKWLYCLTTLSLKD